MPCLKLIFTVGTVLWFHLEPVTCRSDGAPIEACDSLSPNHRRNVATRSFPKVELFVERFEIEAGDSIEVRIHSNAGSSFRGFILQARNEDRQGDRIGLFSVEPGSGVRLMECGGVNGSSVTHDSNLNKRFIRVTWTAPDDFIGNVFFRYSVVETFDTFWTNLESWRPVEVARRTSPPVQSVQRNSTDSSSTTTRGPINFNDVDNTGNNFLVPLNIIRTTSSPAATAATTRSRFFNRNRNRNRNQNSASTTSIAPEVDVGDILPTFQN